MNSVTIVRKFRMNRSPTENAPQNFPNRSMISRALADAGDSAEAHDHLLVNDQHRHEQDQRPQQRQAVVLARLRVRRDTTGVVVADHHDQARAHDRQQCQKAVAAKARLRAVLAKRAERAMDVPDVRVVEDRPPTGRPQQGAGGWSECRGVHR